MQKNILKTSDVTKIYLNFTDGKNHRRREEVKLRYIDNKSCYFVGPTIINFTKPKWRAKTDIIVYTPDGVYSANVIIRETNFSLNNIFYRSLTVFSIFPIFFSLWFRYFLLTYLIIIESLFFICC